MKWRCLTNTFNDMLDRLETAFETQNNFVSNASHELNTPLNSYHWGGRLCAVEIKNCQNNINSRLLIIMQQGDKLKNITQSLVQLARSSFHENLKMEEVNINELLFDAKQNVSNVYSTCTIETVIESKQFASNDNIGNQQLLELALSNVLLNACKYSNSLPGYGSTLQFNRKLCNNQLLKTKALAYLKNELKNIFDPFFRASNVKSIDGYGIGLPLTQNIIRLHKGNIEINSSEDNGTEVVIKLPIKVMLLA